MLYFLFVQIALVIVGIWLMTRRTLAIGSRELRLPYTTFAGLLLAAQLPLAFGTGIALGGAEGIKAARNHVDTATLVSELAKKYWWIDLAVTGGCCLAALALCAASSRVPVLMPAPPDEPIGVTDLRNKLSSLELPWEGPDALPRDPNEPITEMAIRESRRSSIRS